MSKERLLEMLKTITEHLVLDQGSDIIKEAYLELGFTEEEIKDLYNW